MLGNWIRQTTTSTGSGDLTLSAASGFPTFNDVFGTGRYFRYAVIDDATGAPVESGIGHLSASTTLVRDKILATYSGGTYDNTSPAAVSLSSGTWRVVCAADDTALQGVLANVKGDTGAAAGSRRVPLYGIGGITNYGSLSTFTMAANKLYLNAFQLACGQSINKLWLDVSTAAAAGKLIRAGVWGMDHEGRPGKLLFDTGDMAADATGMVGAAVSEQLLPPVWYYSGVVSDGTPIIRSCPVFSPTNGWSSGVARYVNSYSYLSYTYGALGDAPTVGTQSTTVSSNAEMLVWGEKV